MMGNSSNKNSMFIVVTGIIIAVSRFLLGKVKNILFIKDQYVLIVMAVVNYIALGVVLLFLYNELYKRCKNKITSAGLNTAIKKKSNNVMSVISMFLLVVYLLIGTLYMIVLKTSDLNDVISILALAISIATNGLIDDYSNEFYKMILKIAKHISPTDI